MSLLTDDKRLDLRFERANLHRPRHGEHPYETDEFIVTRCAIMRKPPNAPSTPTPTRIRGQKRRKLEPAASPEYKILISGKKPSVESAEQVSKAIDNQPFPNSEGASSHHEASKKKGNQPRKTSPLETLPFDILHDIFFLSVNLNLPLSSPVLGTRLSSEQTYTRFLREFLCYKVSLSPREPLYDDISMYYTKDKPADSRSDNLIPVPMETIAPHMHSLPPATRLRQINPKTVTEMINMALNTRWLSISFLSAFRAGLNDPDRPGAGRALLTLPNKQCMSLAENSVVGPLVPTHKFLPKLGICLAKCRIPSKLLRLPPLPQTTEMLDLLFELGATIDGVTSCDAELAQDMWRYAVVERDFKLIEVLSRPGTGLKPTRVLRRWSLETAKCDREMIVFWKAMRKRYEHSGPGKSWPRKWPSGSFDWPEQWPEGDPRMAAIMSERYGRDWMLELESELKDVLKPEPVKEDANKSKKR